MGQLVAIQILRAAAAAMVAFGHAQADASLHASINELPFERSFALPWGAGVDLFFVISGFIMVYASERLFGAPEGARLFLGRRVARIVPLYWAFCTLYLVWVACAAASSGKALPSLPSILASYAFLPFDGFGDGFPRPFYTLGWTLNYEMFFYAVFAAFLASPRTKAVGGVAGGLALLVLLGTAAPLWMPLAFWAQPIVLEFALGMGIALLFRRGIVLPDWARLALLAGSVGVLAADGMGSAAQAIEWITPNGFARLVAWGLPAAGIVAAAALGPGPSSLSPLARAAAAVGDASYALYLVHPFLIVPARKLWLLAGLGERVGMWPLVGLELALAVGAALLVYRLFEKPVIGAAQAWFVGPRPAATLPAPG